MQVLGFVGRTSTGRRRAYGNFWRHFPIHDVQGTLCSATRFRYVIDEAKRNPMSRRLLVEAWAPGNAQTSRLPPAMLMFVLLNVQLDASGDPMNLHLTQRSADVALGVPTTSPDTRAPPRDASALHRHPGALLRSTRRSTRTSTRRSRMARCQSTTTCRACGHSSSGRRAGSPGDDDRAVDHVARRPPAAPRGGHGRRLSATSCSRGTNLAPCIPSSRSRSERGGKGHARDDCGGAS